MPAQFYETLMGRNFFEGQFPRMVKGIEESNASIEKLTALLERQCALLEEQNALLRNMERGKEQDSPVTKFDKVVITDNRLKEPLPIKYWSNATGDLFNPTRAGIDPWENVIRPHDLPRELQNAYHNLWTEDSGSYCHLVELNGYYGIALINEYEPGEEKMIDDRAKETHKMLEDMEIPFQLVCADEEDRELIVVLPWDVSRDDFDRVTNFLYKTAYDKNISYEQYQESVKENAVTSVKYWSNERGELFRPIKEGEDLWSNRIQKEDLPDALKTAYEQLWTNESGSSCYLVDAYGTYGVALVAEFAKNIFFSNSAEMLNECRDEMLKMLVEEKIPYVTTYADAKRGEVVTVLPWYSSRENLDKVDNFLCVAVYRRGVTYEDYKALREAEQDEREDI